MTGPRPGRLPGRVVVVTGAARGQGAAEAEALAREGALVVATDARPEGGCRRLDVTSEDDWAELAAELKQTYGQVHGLVKQRGHHLAGPSGRRTARGLRPGPRRQRHRAAPRHAAPRPPR